MNLRLATGITKAKAVLDIVCGAIAPEKLSGTSAAFLVCLGYTSAFHYAVTQSIPNHPCRTRARPSVPSGLVAR